MEARHLAGDRGRRVAVDVWRLTVAALAALALAAAGCGGDDGDSGPGKASGDTVAVVDGEEVSREDLERQVEAVERSQTRGGGQEPDREQLEDQALATLVQTRLLEAEAEERGIEVDMDEVRRRWRSAAAQQFDGEEDLRRFLGGQTEEDVLRQLRLQELTERIHEDIRKEADGRPARAVEQFQQRLARQVRKAMKESP